MVRSRDAIKRIKEGKGSAGGRGLFGHVTEKMKVAWRTDEAQLLLGTEEMEKEVVLVVVLVVVGGAKYKSSRI